MHLRFSLLQPLFFAGYVSQPSISSARKVSYDSYRYLSTQQHDVYIFFISIRFPSSQAHESQPSPISGMLITGKFWGQVFSSPQDLMRPLGYRGDTRGPLRMLCASMAMSCVSLPTSLFSSARKRSWVGTGSQFHSSSLIHPKISTLHTRRTSRSL